ncbi:nitroreductase family protein [Coprothermobacter platensis]|uniref:nitroreductase family protein n=1 Tax=Coprothermobacter platensis TaxID=108819 RepID=UPI0003A8A4FC|nr:nitroreductase family protein [Coprothermobacter platensis]
MDDIYELIKQRRSIRNFKPDPIDESVIKRILEAGLWAPSAGNLQARTIFVVTKEQMKRDLSDACFGQDHVAQAPLVLVGCTDVESMRSYYGKRGTTLYGICDVSAAMENIILAAWQEGIGTCWVGNFDEEQVRHALRIDKRFLPVVVVAMGYPLEVPPAPARKCFDEGVIVL